MSIKRNTRKKAVRGPMGALGYARKSKMLKKPKALNESCGCPFANLPEGNLSRVKSVSKGRYTANPDDGVCFRKTPQGCFEKTRKAKNFQACGLSQGEGVWCSDDKIKSGACGAVKRSCKR